MAYITEKKYIFMIKINQQNHGLLKRGYDKTGFRRRYCHGQCKYENIKSSRKYELK